MVASTSEARRASDRNSRSGAWDAGSAAQAATAVALVLAMSDMEPESHKRPISRPPGLGGRDAAASNALA